jgi:outer membrane protein OmpA-like peptidoglycan-associated protein
MTEAPRQATRISVASDDAAKLAYLQCGCTATETRLAADIWRRCATVLGFLILIASGGSSSANVAATPTILFGFDSASIDQTGQTVIDQVASELRATMGYSITVTGHTDRAGPQSYNMELSRRRAEAVRHALIANGISGESIKIQAVGESQSAVPTDDSVHELANRRVEIVIEGGAGTWNTDQP